MSAPHLVVFDLDGTLVDSSAAIVATLDAAMAVHGLPPAPRQDAIDLIGLPLGVMFPRLARAAADASLLESLITSYKALYPELAEKHEAVIPGVPDLVSSLAGRGCALAIATSKGTRGARAALARHGLRSHFDLVLGFDAVDRPKPAPDMVNLAMATLRASPNQTVMIGDTEYDMAMGCAAGTRTIGVTWGSHGAARLLGGGATRVVDSIFVLGETLDSLVFATGPERVW